MRYEFLELALHPEIRHRIAQRGSDMRIALIGGLGRKFDPMRIPIIGDCGNCPSGALPLDNQPKTESNSD